MIKDLITNKETHFWSTSPNKTTLGTRDKFDSAIIEFQFDDNEARITPVFYPERHNNPSRTRRFDNSRQEYTDIIELHKIISEYLDISTNSEIQNKKRVELSNNSTNFIKRHF